MDATPVSFSSSEVEQGSSPSPVSFSSNEVEQQAPAQQGPVNPYAIDMSKVAGAAPGTQSPAQAAGTRPYQPVEKVGAMDALMGSEAPPSSAELAREQRSSEAVRQFVHGPESADQQTAEFQQTLHPSTEQSIVAADPILGSVATGTYETGAGLKDVAKAAASGQGHAAIRGANRTLQGAMTAGSPAFGVAVYEAPIKMAASYFAGVAAGKGASAVAADLGMSQDAQELANTVGFFIPNAFMTVSQLRGEINPEVGKITNPQTGEQVGSVNLRGGVVAGRGFAAGVAKGDPGQYQGAVRVGPYSARVNIGGDKGFNVEAGKGEPGQPLFGGNGAPPEPEAPPAPPSATAVQAKAQMDEITRLAASAKGIQTQAEQVTGMRPPPPPPPAPGQPGSGKVPKPAGMDDGHLSPKTVEAAGQAIQMLPEEARPKAVLEAVGNLANWMDDKKTIIGPDNKVVSVDTPKAAQSAAVKIINDEMERQTQAAGDAAQEKQENLATAQQEREEALNPAKGEKSTENAQPVEIPNTPQVQKARAAIQAAPADGTADHFDQIIRKTAMVTTPVRKALVQEEISRRANMEEQQSETAMTGESPAEGQDRASLQAWADGVKRGDHPFVHVPAKSSFIPTGVEDLTRTKVNGAGPFSGTYYHASEVSAADIRKAARDKQNPQGALDAIVSKFKGEEKPVEFSSNEVEKQEVQGESKEDKGRLREGELGELLAAGEKRATSTGRETSPFPKVDTTSDRKAGNTVKRVDQWLMDNAIEEARSRGDEFNLRQFEHNRDKPSQADKDSAEMYLFDKGSIHPIPKPFMKPITLPEEAAREVRKGVVLPADLAKSKPRYGYRDKNFELDFEDPRDLAAYTVGQKNPNKAHDRFMDFLHDYVGDDAAISDRTKAVKEALKKMAKDANPEDGPLKVPSQHGVQSKPETITLPPEAHAGLTALVDDHASDNPEASLESVLRDPEDGKIIAQALVNDGIITNSDMDSKTALLTTQTRKKLTTSVLGGIFGDELMKETPDFVREKLSGVMGTLGIINSKDDEWNLKKPLESAIRIFNQAHRGEEIPAADVNPVNEALVKMLDGPIDKLRQAVSNYAVVADSVRDQYKVEGDPDKPYLAFNIAFGTELTEEQFKAGLKPVEKPIKPEPVRVSQHTSEMALMRADSTPMLDIHREPTGWLKFEHDNGTVLVHPYENEMVYFNGEDRRSGADALRAKAEAQAYAIDNPVEPKPAGPAGELIIKPIFKREEAKPLAKGDKVTYRTNKGKERTGEVAFTDGRIVRIKDGGSEVTKKVEDVKPVAGSAETAKPKTLVDALQTSFRSGAAPKDYNGLKKIVAEFDGKEPDQLRMKQGQEAFETMVNREARDIVDLSTGGARVPFDRLVKLYESQPNLSIRTSTSIDNQAYSTPLPLAFIADRFAGIDKTSTVYEPTAGNGALLIAADPNRVYANELDPSRAATLNAEGYAKVSQNDATTWSPALRFDAVVANPPFSKLPGPVEVDGYKIIKLDHLIAAKALGVMKDSGKATIIIGAGDRNQPGEITNQVRPFFNWLYSHYNVVSDFELEGDLYARQGASWPVRVIAVDGRMRTAKVSPLAEDIQRLKTWGDVYERASEHLGSNLEGQRRANDVAGSAERPEETQSAAVPATATGLSGKGDSGLSQTSAAGHGGNGLKQRVGSISHLGTVPDPGVGSPDITVRPDGDVALSNRLAEGQRAPKPVKRESSIADGHSANALADESNQFQGTYTPRSAKKDVSVMAPLGLIAPMHEAMDRIFDDVGDIDQWVADELGYPDVDTMQGAFMGIQSDAIAAAIHNIQKGKSIIVADQCIAGETRIFDPTRGIHVPIKELAEIGNPITVLALTPTGMEPVSASSPFRKGVADLYRVGLADGRSITVTRNHRFLCSDGWKTIAQGLSVGHSVATSLSPEDQKSADSASTRKVDARHYSQTVLDLMDRCSSYLSPDGAQLQSDQDSGQAYSPSQADAPLHNPASSRLDGLELSQEHSDLGLSSGLHSRKSSSPSESHDPSSISDRAVAWYERLLALKPQSVLQSPQYPFSLPEVSGEEPLRLPASHYDLPSGASSSSLCEDAKSRSGLPSPCESQLRPNLVQTDTTGEPQSTSLKSSYADYTGWQAIESIEFVRNDEFFDMWVPGYENYVAEGFINHNTGVGKGRVAAAIIRWTEMHGMLPVFMTESSPLFSAMHSDLHDIGSGDSITPLLFNADATITDPVTGRKIYGNNGSMRPVFDRIIETGEIPAGRNAVYLSYSQINTPNRQQSALQRLAPNAVFILDESHNAGGDSNTGNFLQSVLSASKGVTFLSATWAKRPDNLPLYASKTDIAIAIPDKDKIADAITAGGAPLQAVVTNQLASAGQLVRRERSFDGIKIENHIDEAHKDLHEKISDRVTEVLRAIVQADHLYHELDFSDVQAKMKAAGKGGKSAKVVVNHMEFSSVVHNMVKQLLLALKADESANHIIKAIESGQKPIFALENTMGSFLDGYVNSHNLREGDPLEGLTYSKISDRALMRTRYYNETDEMGNSSRVEVPLESLSPKVREAYDQAQELIDNLEADLPVSPIDYIRNQVEKAGYKIAEITGRTAAIDYSGDVPKLATVPGIEKKDRVNTASQFNNGGLDALIINRAGSTGISLHASEKFRDQRPRLMIVGQPAGDVNIVMQILGRINRTGQVVLPAYNMLACALPAEARPAINLAKKMKSLNANVSSNTRSATSIQAVDLMNKYGDEVIGQYLLDNPEMAKDLGLKVEEGANGKIDGAENLSMKATGRSALLPVAKQREFMDAITEAYTHYIDFLDETGQNDLEPRTYDFEARELHLQQIYQGTDQTSPFGQDAQYGEYSIKRQGKPFTPQEVAEKIANTFGPEAMQKPPRERDTLAARALADHMEELYKPYKESLKTDGAIERAEGIRQLGRSILNDYRVGTGLRIDINGDLHNAVVTNIEGAKKPSGNPYAPSALQFTLAVNSSLRQTKVPGSKLKSITVFNLGRNADIPKLFHDLGDARQKAKIITGNLLGAYGQFKAGVKGRIITFTMADGTAKMGILMPNKFDVETDVSNDYAMRSDAGALAYLNSGHKLYLTSSGQEVGVSGNTRDGMEIRTKTSKVASGRFFLDPKLRELVVGGDFASQNGMMRATVKDGAELQALKVIMQKIALYPTAHDADRARDIEDKLATSPAATPKAATRLSTGGEAYSFLGSYQIAQGAKRTAKDLAKLGRWITGTATPATMDDLMKAAKLTTRTMKQAGREVVAALYPRALADEDAKNIMGRGLGHVALSLFHAGQLMDGVGRMFQGMPQDDQIKFVDRWQNGQDQPTKDLQKAQELLQSILEGQREQEREAINLGRKPKDQIEVSDRANYFPNRYKTPPGGQKAISEEEQMMRLNAPSRRPLEGNKNFMKQQKYSLKDAVEAGAVPLGTPADMIMRRIQEGAKFVAAKQIMNAFKESGLVIFLKQGKQLPVGYARIDDKIAKVWRPVDTAEGGTLYKQAGEWVGQEDAMRLLNNYLSKDYIRGASIGRGIVALKNATTAAGLAWSPFHWLGITVRNWSGGMHIGIDRLYNQGLRGADSEAAIQGLVEIGASIAAPFTAVKTGGQMIQYARNPDEFLNSPEGKKFVQTFPDYPHLQSLLFAGGLRWGMPEVFKDAETGFVNNIASGHLGKATLQAFPWLTYTITKPLFEHYIPRAKWNYAARLLASKLDQYSEAIADGSMTEEQIARDVASATENQFGEFHYDSVYWNNTMKTATQLLFRSASWKLGTVRTAIKAGQEQFTSKMFDDHAYEHVRTQAEEGDWYKKAAARLPQLGTNAGSIVALVMFTTIIGTITTKLASGKWPWEWAQEDHQKLGHSYLGSAAFEAIHPRTGFYDQYGEPTRFSIPSDLKDYEHIMNSGVKSYLASARSDLVANFMDTMQNRDAFGNYVFNPNDPLYKEFSQGLAYNMEGDFEPYVARPLLPRFMTRSSDRRGSTDLMSQIERGSGLVGGAPKSFDRSEATNLALSKRTHTPMTPEQQQEREMLNEAPPTRHQALYALRTKNLSDLDKIMMGLSYTDAKDVYSHATPEEQQTLRPIMARKQARAVKEARRR